MVRDDLRFHGHEVYDFRNPAPGESGFAWTEVDPKWETWSAGQFIHALSHPVSIKGYGFDKAALDWCDTCVCLLPSGKSAHLEAGYAIGRGKPTYFLMYGADTVPELMYLLGQGATTNFSELLSWLRLRDMKEAQARRMFRSEP